MKKILTFNLLFIIFGFTYGQKLKSNIVGQQNLNNVNSQFFIENKGQWPSEVLYLTQIGGLNTWITTKGMLYEFYKTQEINKTEKGKFDDKQYKSWGQRISYTLSGDNETRKTEGKLKLQGYKNYLIGNDDSKYASNS